MNQCFTNQKAAFRKISAGVLVGAATLLSHTAGAQQRLLMGADSYPVADKGATVKTVAATLQLDAEGKSIPTDIVVTATFESQQFSDVQGNTTGTGMQFGAGQNTSGKGASDQAAWTSLAAISNPTNNLFSQNATTELGRGIEASTNYGFSVFCTTRPLAGMPTNSRQLMGQFKLSFNKAVSNPILHLAGLGGTVNTLGITTELELVSKGVSLAKLSGTDNLDISGSEIRNDAANPDASSYTGAATGSVAVNGKDITELVFNVYLKGDGGSDKWEQENQYNGDRWTIGVSLQEEPKAIATLPIYVTNFNVTHEEACSATFRWKTSTELGVSDFYLERSIDGTTFEVIYSFPSKGTAEGDYYAYTYRHATSGANYFRIRTHDVLSETNYGSVVKVLVTCDERPIEVFPNPAQDYIRIKGAAAGQTVQISNMFGKVQQTKKLSSPDESLSLEGMQPGIYVLIVSNEQGEEVSRTRINKQ